MQHSAIIPTCCVCVCVCVRVCVCERESVCVRASSQLPVCAVRMYVRERMSEHLLVSVRAESVGRECDVIPSF